MICGGEVFDHLVHDGVFSEANAARLMREAATALAFLHGIGVVHADLKPENLMLCSKNREHGTLKIVDFGSAKVTSDSSYHDDDDVLIEPPCTSKPAESTGTVAYWPPERFADPSEPKPAMDMWSTGVILYIMLTGAHPFDPEGCTADDEVERRIKANPRAPMAAMNEAHLSPAAIDLIKKLMEPDPSKRLDAAGMLEHSWVKEGTAEKSKMYQCSCSPMVAANQNTL